MECLSPDAHQLGGALFWKLFCACLSVCVSRKAHEVTFNKKERSVWPGWCAAATSSSNRLKRRSGSSLARPIVVWVQWSEFHRPAPIFSLPTFFVIGNEVDCNDVVCDTLQVCIIRIVCFIQVYTRCVVRKPRAICPTPGHSPAKWFS